MRKHFQGQKNDWMIDVARPPATTPLKPEPDGWSVLSPEAAGDAAGLAACRPLTSAVNWAICSCMLAVASVTTGGGVLVTVAIATRAGRGLGALGVKAERQR